MVDDSGKQTLLCPCATRNRLRLFFHRGERAHQPQRFGVKVENLQQLAALGTISPNRPQTIDHRVVAGMSRTFPSPLYRPEF